MFILLLRDILFALPSTSITITDTSFAIRDALVLLISILLLTKSVLDFDKNRVNMIANASVLLGQEIIYSFVCCISRLLMFKSEFLGARFLIRIASYSSSDYLFICNLKFANTVLIES